MKKSLLILSMLIFASSQILSRGFTVYNKASQKVWVKADGQLADSKQKKGIEIKDGYISVDKDKDVYIETGSGERGAEWYYNKMPKTKYYTYLKYASPDKLTIKDYNENYTMNQTAGYKKDEQKPLTKEDKEKKQAAEKAAENAKKEKADLDKEIKKISGYKKIDDLFRYIDDKKKVLEQTKEDNTIKKLETYATAALDQIVKKYSEQINKTIKNTEFDINTFKVELNNIEDKINNRIKDIKRTPKNLMNIHKQECDAYKEGKTYSIEEKTGSKSYPSILDAIITRRGKLGVAKEPTKQLKIYTDTEIKKTEFKSLNKHLEDIKKEIARLDLKHKAEKYTADKIKNDAYYQNLTEALPKVQEKRDELSKTYKEERAEKAAKEKEERAAREKEEKEEKITKTKEKIEEKETAIKEKETAIKEKETAIKEKETELESEKARAKEQEEKNTQDIKDMETTEKAKIDADAETEKINIDAKHKDASTEQEKKVELEAVEKNKTEKLTELTKNIALKKVEQKTALVSLTLEVDNNIKQKTKELEALKTVLAPLKTELETLKTELETLKTDLEKLKK